MSTNRQLHGSLPSGQTAPSPRIDCWLPEKNHKGIGLVILPGGGYVNLAAHEGKGYAEHFELHVYAKGRHGLGLNAPFAWATDCLRWMEETCA